MRNSTFEQPCGTPIDRHARRRRAFRSRASAWIWWRLLSALALATGLALEAFSAAPAAVAATPAATPSTVAAAADGQIFPPGTGVCPPPSYQVPDGVYLVRVVAIGGAGQSGQDYDGISGLDTHAGGRGGQGAKVTAVVPVIPGQRLYVDAARNGGGPNETAAGWRGGGIVYWYPQSFQVRTNFGNAGGASFVYKDNGNGCSLGRDTYLVVAGGGGGGAGGQAGGGGGRGGDAGVNADGSGENGQNGRGDGCGYGRYGSGGSLSGPGGGGGSSCAGDAGQSGTDSYGGQVEAAKSASGTSADGHGEGGAGGGGYYGAGSGGSGIVGGGGGGAGSSYVASGLVKESIATTSEAPMVSITPIARPPDSQFRVGAGYNYSCFLAASNSAACWGDNGSGRATPPAGAFRSISVGLDFACGIKTDGTIACWGDNTVGQTNAPSGQFHQVRVGDDFACALTVASTIRCWGARNLASPGLYSSITTGSNYLCALSTDQSVKCWSGSSLVPSTTPAAARFTSIAGGYIAPCGIQTDGTGLCWGGAYAPPVPAGTFTTVSSGPYGADMCWTRADGTVTCTMSPYFDSVQQAGTPPNGTYSALSTGNDHACGIPTSGGVVCWGDNTSGEVVPKVTAAWPDPNNIGPPAAISGQPYSFALGFTYMSPAGTLTMIDGVLPPGITLSPAGVLAGTSTKPGRYPFTLQVANGVGPTGYFATILEVSGPPSFTSANSATFTVGNAGNFSIVAEGPPRPTLSLYGTLPPGVRFQAFPGSALLTGTPQTGSGGAYPLTLVAGNGVQPDAVQSFMLYVNEPPVFTSGEGVTFGLNSSNSFTVAAKGYPRPTLSLSGALPAGVTFDAATGLLSGTPTGSGGSYPLTFTASNGIGSDATQSFNLSTAAWAPIAPLPDIRLNLAAATGADGTIYAIGGANQGFTPQGTTFALAPGATAWRSVAGLPLSFGEGRMYAAAATGLDGTIYLIGGVDRTYIETQSSVFAYTPATDSWRGVASLPDSRAGMATAVGADGTIYALGGWSGRIGVSGEYFNTVFAFTPATNTWRSVANLPDIRYDLAAATGSDGTIYAIGGSNRSFAPQESVFAYSPASNTWTSAPSLPATRTRLAATRGADGTIYAIGGGDTAYTLAPGATSWTQAPNLPARHGLAAVSGPGGVIYAIGGQDQNFAGQSSVLAYLPTGAQANPAPTTSGLSIVAVQAGQAGFALTVSGANFLPGATVRVESASGASTLTPSAVAAGGALLSVGIPAGLIARPDTLRVAVVNGGPGGGTSNLQPLFVTQASAAVTSSSTSTSGTATTGGITLSASGGSGTIAVATYAANPGATPSFNTSGAYFDAYVAPGSSYTSVQIVNCSLGGGTKAYWYNATTNSWVEASNQSYNPTNQCLTINVSNSTTPNLANLGGTPFGIAKDPLAVSVPGAQSAIYGQQLSFTVSASSASSSAQVTIAASGLPAGLSIGPTSFDQAAGKWIATVSGRITALAGSYTASFIASDGSGSSAAQTVVISVKLFAAGNLLVANQNSADCHLLLNSGASVTAAGAAAINGASASALCLNSAKISASSITVQGGVRNNNSTVQGSLLTRQPATADLLATLPAPSAPAAACPGTACPDGTTANSGRTNRLLPGTYTAPITGNSGGTLCVAPGIYVLKASWTLNSSALRPYGGAGCPALPSGVTDPGVLLYFAQGNVVVNSSGDFTQLRAMASGPYAGLLYWQAGSESTLLNGSVGFGGGAWYQPKGTLTLNGSTRMTAPYVVAAAITVNGGTRVTVTGP